MRRARGLALVLGLSAAGLWAGAAAATAAHLVDDRGEAIQGELRICRTVALEQNCEDVAVDGSAVEIEPFEVLQVSGAEHGPARFRERPADGTFRVPRKAYLAIAGEARAEGVVASLYAATSEGFRRPVERFEVTVPSTVRVPAGSWLLSLADADGAPDLHVVTAGPAEEVAATYQRRGGWSVVVRVVGEGDEPLARARARLTPTPGYGETEARDARTGEAGLVVISGLSVELADVEVTHEDYLAERVAAVSASSGSFAVREVQLPVGGRLRGRATLEGEPLVGATWVVRAPGGPGDGWWKEVASGTTGEDGGFEAGPLRPGLLGLRVRPSAAEAEASALAGVRVASGETTEVAVDLVRHEVEGQVRVDGEPAAGFGVGIAAAMTGAPGDRESVARATVDESGSYRLAVWEEGEYTVTVVDAERRLVDVGRVWVGRDGGTLDFDLRVQRLEGRAVDERGEPLPEARVAVGWNRKYSMAPVDEDGWFELALEGSGTAEITGVLDGYARPDPVRVEVTEGESPPPVVVRFERLGGFTGTVHAGGAPRAGVQVFAYEPGGEQPRSLGSAASDAAGEFRIASSRRGRTRLFLSGPGCPLTLVEAVVDEEPLELDCAAVGGNLVLHLADREGEPRAGLELALARSGVAVPGEVLTRHLQGLGLAARTTAGGEIVVAAVEPGRWAVFLARGANAATIEAGRPFGLLTAAEISARQTTELDVVVSTPRGE